jgi:hypothetical protein
MFNSELATWFDALSEPRPAFREFRRHVITLCLRYLAEVINHHLFRIASAGKVVDQTKDAAAVEFLSMNPEIATR